MINLPIYTGRIGKTIKTTGKLFMGYLAICGLITFSLFILEESFQTMMFGTWPAQDAGRWDIVKNASDKMQKVMITLDKTNNWFGWVQPFAYVAYGEYVKAEKVYLQGLEAKAMANCPQCYVGRVVTIQFKPDSKEYDNGKIIHRAGAVQVWADTETIPGEICGKIQPGDNGGIVIDIRKR
jgi:hypothetical protein